MNKRELIKLLEPFTDDTPIVFFDESGYNFNLAFFYQVPLKERSACIVASKDFTLADKREGLVKLYG